MYYDDGSIYEGEWFAGKRSGKGLYKQENGDRYEGLWENDKKNGEGKFFYMERGLVYTGSWKDDIPKCGAMEQLPIVAPRPLAYPIPKVRF